MPGDISALHIAELAELPESTLDLLDKGQRPLLLFDWLLAEERYVDAIRFVSQGFPSREAIWWGSLSLLLADLPPFSEAEQAILAGSARWVIAPAEEHSIAVREAVPAVKAGKPAHLLALAVGAASEEATGHSKTCGDCVAGALINAALRGKPELIMGKYQIFLALAVAILQGKFHWPKPAPGQPVPKAARPAGAY